MHEYNTRSASTTIDMLIYSMHPFQREHQLGLDSPAAVLPSEDPIVSLVQIELELEPKPFSSPLPLSFSMLILYDPI